MNNIFLSSFSPFYQPIATPPRGLSAGAFSPVDQLAAGRTMVPPYVAHDMHPQPLAYQPISSVRSLSDPRVLGVDNHWSLPGHSIQEPSLARAGTTERPTSLDNSRLCSSPASSATGQIMISDRSGSKDSLNLHSMLRAQDHPGIRATSDSSIRTSGADLRMCHRQHLFPTQIISHCATGLLAHSNSFSHYPYLHIKPQEEPVDLSMKGEVKKSPGIKSEIPTNDDGEAAVIKNNCHWQRCEEKFNSKDNLVKHVNQSHVDVSDKPFICEWVDCHRKRKPFQQLNMIVAHMRHHTGEKPYGCQIEGCDKAYSRLENLKTHVRSHKGEKPYRCKWPGCTKAFNNTSDCSKHQARVHSNEKAYVCRAPYCNKRYTDPSSLRKHVKNTHGADFYASKKHKGHDYEE